jgi:putative phosphoesterase
MREEALRRLAGVDLIIHAGDVGSPEVLDALGKIAPVYAVRGNVDTEPWARSLPERRVVEVQGCRILVLHKLADVDPGTAAERFDAVIFGHSHKYAEERRDATLYLNPGSAGPRRFRLPVSLARVMVDGDSITVERIGLAGG